MSNYETLKTKVIKEHEEHKSHILQFTPEQVYDNFYEISFFEEYTMMFVNDYVLENVSSETIDWLCSFENPIEFLYSEWLSCDAPTSYDWDDMISFINELYISEEER